MNCFIRVFPWRVRLFGFWLECRLRGMTNLTWRQWNATGFKDVKRRTA